MKLPNRDLLVLIKDRNLSEQSIEMQVNGLNEMLRHVESADHLTTAHEFIDRNGITHNRNKILKAIGAKTLKPFRFLLNKN
jgi:hypothetical protein